MGNDSDLREQILEAAEEEDVSGQLLQQTASKKGKPLSETRFDSPSAIIANNSKSMNRSGELLEDPKFIIAIVVAQYVLSFLKPLTLFLQRTNCDMVVAFENAFNTRNVQSFSL